MGPRSTRQRPRGRESTITWANRPARSGPAVDDRAAIAVGAWVDYNVTSLVTGDGTIDLVLGADLQ